MLKNSFAQIATNQSIKAIYEAYQHANTTNESKEKIYHISFYKKYISKQISAHCQFNNSCSSFMFEARQHYGLGKGLLLGIDRLSRCGASEETYNYLPALKVYNNYSYIDHIYFYD
jgi:putative component of membrane protein insertase Oxa1/YidC/SpoIIIJ protein YidD